MMHELSFRFQKRIEIGQFMGYSAEDILKAVNTLEFDRYAMRNADKSLLDKQFYQFRCYLYHNSKKS